MTVYFPSTVPTAARALRTLSLTSSSVRAPLTRALVRGLGKGVVGERGEGGLPASLIAASQLQLFKARFLRGASGDGAPILILSERQVAILKACSRGARSVEEVAAALGLRREDLMRDLEELRARGLVRVERSYVERVEPTDDGLRYARSLLPEEKVARVVERWGEVRVEEIPRLASGLGLPMDKAEVDVGIMHLARHGALTLQEGVARLKSREALDRALREAEGLRAALEGLARGERVPSEIAEVLRRRKLAAVRRVTVLYVSLTDEARALLSSGGIASRPVVTALTPELIVSGRWKEVEFKEYDLSVPPPRLYPGRKHPYLEFLDEVRGILTSMGFEEMKGPYVELEFWNFDALFQAQDHPAREIHDTFYLAYPSRGRVGDAGLLARIAEAHESGGGTGSLGWRYRWDPSRALRLILRTQTTAVSARTLYARGDGEYRCFALSRVFRPENLDAKHSMEFYQLEGIIVGRSVTLRNLIGFFEELARVLRLGPVRIKPAYFPFTEPSVEGFIRHPKLGWIEVFPGGMFRPEVVRPLGLRECNVAAWGIGIDRIAMTVLGVDDIRLLFSQDLEFLRNWRPPLRW